MQKYININKTDFQEVLISSGFGRDYWTLKKLLIAWTAVMHLTLRLLIQTVKKSNSKVIQSLKGQSRTLFYFLPPEALIFYPNLHRKYRDRWPKFFDRWEKGITGLFRKRKSQGKKMHFNSARQFLDASSRWYAEEENKINDGGLFPTNQY